MPAGESRQMLEEHLAQAEKAVALGLKHIARQRRILAELIQDHHERAAAAAEELLMTFLETQSATRTGS